MYCVDFRYIDVTFVSSSTNRHIIFTAFQQKISKMHAFICYVSTSEKLKVIYWDCLNVFILFYYSCFLVGVIVLLASVLLFQFIGHMITEDTPQILPMNLLHCHSKNMASCPLSRWGCHYLLYVHLLLYEVGHNCSTITDNYENIIIDL